MKPRLEIRFPYRMQCAFLFGRPYQGKRNEFLLNHARSGLVLALKSLNLPEKSKVGVMAYNCHTVFNAVAQTGLNPVFIDVTEGLLLDTNDLENKYKELSALVVTHLFGLRNSISYIRERFPNLPIIEDCAHAYGLRDYEGDFVVFSVGQGKFPSLGDGGILLVNNSTYLDTVTSLYGAIQDYRFYESVRLFFKLCLKSVLSIPFLYSLITRSYKRKRKLPSGIERINLKRMNRGISSMYEIERNDIHKKIEKRILNAERISQSIKGFSKEVSILIGENAFMLVVKPADKIELKKRFLARGIEAETHFSHCIDWALGFGYSRGSCPCTERLVHSLLMIPTYE